MVRVRVTFGNGEVTEIQLALEAPDKEAYAWSPFFNGNHRVVHFTGVE